MEWDKEKKESAINDILEALEDGESLVSFIKRTARDVIPSRGTFYVWLKDDEALQDKYARACEVRSEKMFEEMLDIADDGTNDYMTVVKGDIAYNVEDKEVVNRSRLRIDTRKWILSKMQPKKYGDRLDVTSGGEKIQSQSVTVTIVPPTEDEE